MGRTRRFLAAGVVALGVLVTPSVATASAPTAQEITGTFAEQPPSFTVRLAGKTGHVDFSALVDFGGDIAGTATSTGFENIAPDGDFSVQAVVTCTCSVAGRTGDLVLGFTGQGSLVTQEKTGHFVISGSGGLAGLHGTGSFTQSGLTGTWVADIKFAP